MTKTVVWLARHGETQWAAELSLLGEIRDRLPKRSA